MVIKTAKAESLPKQSNNTEFNYAEWDRITNGKYPLLKKIGECESGFNMVPNKGGLSSAYGIFQILKIHDARATKLGISRFTVEGNIKLAIDIYLEQGTTPWNASKHCWG